MPEIKKRIRVTPKKVKKSRKGTDPSNPQGRPTIYQDSIGALICKGIQEGKTLLKISKDPKVPSLPTIYSWLNRMHPMFKECFFNAYNEAKRLQAEAMAEEIVDISDGSGDIQKNRLRIDTRKWLASKILPSKYSDKVQLTGNEDSPLIPGTINLVVDFGDSK
jgi:hypothetical protein